MLVAVDGSVVKVVGVDVDVVVEAVVEAVLLVEGQTACAVSVPDPPTVAVVLILLEEATETPPELVQEENDAPAFGLKVTEYVPRKTFTV